MSADTSMETAVDASGNVPQGADLPTAPSSVVWSGGHAYVLEGGAGRARWVGVDDRGRPQFLTDADLHRRGWSHYRH